MYYMYIKQQSKYNSPLQMYSEEVIKEIMKEGTIK